MIELLRKVGSLFTRKQMMWAGVAIVVLVLGAMFWPQDMIYQSY